MKKLTLSTLEVLNILAWENQLSKEKMDAIPLKVRYGLKKFTNKIVADGKSFEEIRDTEIEKIQGAYSSDEKSYDVEEVVKDENGEVMKDEDGKDMVRTNRKVKEEYLEEYNLALEALNDKLTEILKETNEYEVNPINIEEVVNNLPDDTPLEFDDINILDAIFSPNEEA